MKAILNEQCCSGFEERLKAAKRRKRHLPCWKRKRYTDTMHQSMCRRFQDCCICAGWHDELHR